MIGRRQLLRRKRTTRAKDGCDRYDERWTRSTRSKTNLKTRKRTTRHAFKTNATDTMKDGQEARKSKTRLRRSSTHFTTKANDTCLRWMRTIRWKIQQARRSKRHVTDGYEQKVRTKGPTQILRGNGGCERCDESWTRSTKTQDTLTTDTNERSSTNFTTKATNTCLTTVTNDTMKDGGTMTDGQEARRSNNFNDDANESERHMLTTDANDTLDKKQKVPRHIHDGCERHNILKTENPPKKSRHVYDGYERCDG